MLKLNKTQLKTQIKLNYKRKHLWTCLYFELYTLNFESKSFCQYLWLEGSQMYDSRIGVVTVQREGRCPSSLATVRNSTASLVLMQRAAHTQTAAPSAWETERALSLIRTPRAQQGLCHFTYRAPEITPLLMLKIKISFHWRMWRLESCFVFTFLPSYSFPSRGSWEKVPGFFKAWQVDRQELVQRVCNLNTQLSEVFPIIQADTCGSKTRGR